MKILDDEVVKLCESLIEQARQPEPGTLEEQAAQHSIAHELNKKLRDVLATSVVPGNSRAAAFPVEALQRIVPSFYHFFSPMFPKGLSVTLIVGNSEGDSTVCANLEDDALISVLKTSIETLEKRSDAGRAALT